MASPRTTGLEDRLLAFIVERFPLALPLVRSIVQRVPCPEQRVPKAIDAYGARFCKELEPLSIDTSVDRELEATPGISAQARLKTAAAELTAACRAFFER